jgi:hypothetical protein
MTPADGTDATLARFQRQTHRLVERERNRIVEAQAVVRLMRTALEDADGLEEVFYGAKLADEMVGKALDGLDSLYVGRALDADVAAAHAGEVRS